MSTPNPAALLKTVQADYSGRGKLKVFLGAAPGVGKTYAMLQAAHQAIKKGIDVQSAIIETHGRSETTALAQTIPSIPRKSYSYRGKQFSEIDLDKIIRLKPDLVLVDELAHSNVPGAIHKKRYLDIIELLDHGINVYTTVNIQHLESLNDEVQHITKIKVQETIPDSILEQANDIVVIDLPINELLERLEQGKVYIKDQANRAVHHFFTPVKLMALRELTLKIAAKNVNNQALTHQAALGIDDCYLNGNTIMVCLSANPITPRLIRQAKQLAQSHKSQLIATYIETPQSIYYSHNKKKRVQHYIRLAEQLGFHSIITPASNQAKAIIQTAEKHNVNLIVMGKSIRHHWRDKIQGSIVHEVIRQSGKINVHIINDNNQDSRIKPLAVNTKENQVIPHYLKATLLTILAGSASWCFSHYLSPESTAIMLFLLANIYSAYRWGAKVSLYSSCLGLLIYCIFFIPPYNSLALGSIQGILTFGVFSVISLAAHYITSRLRAEKQSLIKREKYYKTLLIFSEKIAATRDIKHFLDQLKKEIFYIFNTDSLIILNIDKNIKEINSNRPSPHLKQSDHAAIWWSSLHNKACGYSTETFSGSPWYFSPLIHNDKTMAVIALYQPQANKLQQLMPMLQKIAVQKLVDLQQIKYRDNTT